MSIFWFFLSVSVFSVFIIDRQITWSTYRNDEKFEIFEILKNRTKKWMSTKIWLIFIGYKKSYGSVPDRSGPQILDRRPWRPVPRPIQDRSLLGPIQPYLWEISSGQPPFFNELNDVSLAMEISQGLREIPVSNTPENYVKIYTGNYN